MTCFGAENEARTRDPNLGKVVLYQLSYFRIFPVWDCKGTNNFETSKLFSSFLRFFCLMGAFLIRNAYVKDLKIPIIGYDNYSWEICIFAKIFERNVISECLNDCSHPLLS